MSGADLCTILLLNHGDHGQGVIRCKKSEASASGLSDVQIF